MSHFWGQVQPLPVVLNGDNIANLTVEQLRNTCDRDRWAVLIQGEGGLGKTTLACQLALWGMADDPAERLCGDRRMLPVLIEPGLAFDIRWDMATFEAAIRGRLEDLLGLSEPVPEGLFEQLLRTRRILVILDGLSEMPAAPDAPEAIRPGNADFPVSALLVTSRTDEWLSQKATILPSRIDSEHLAGFMNAYATQSGQANLKDAALFEACRGLAEMVSAGGREVTPLLAKLYAEQLVALSERGEALENLPASVPDLMLSYLNNLNRDRQEADPDDPTVHRAASITAWECLRKTYRPGQGKKEDIRAALRTVDLSEELPAYLEDRLRVIRTIEPAQTHVQFVMDPLSEYLAGLRLVELYGNSEEKWRGFLNRADLMPGSPEAIKGFLLAVRDCCEAKGAEHGVPDFVAEELGKRAGLDPEVVERAKLEGRVQQMIQNLRSFEARDRVYACNSLRAIGPTAAAAVLALIEALKDGNRGVRRSAADALGSIGPATEAAVPALFEALTDDDSDVRSNAAFALGRIGPPAEPALGEALKDDDRNVRLYAAVALGRIGPAAVPAFGEALTDDDSGVRRSAADALVNIGPAAEAAVPALCEALKHGDRHVRGRAADALRKIGPAAQAAVPALIEALKDDDRGVRSIATVALRSIGPAAVPALIEALKDDDRGVRSSAADALGSIGPAAAAAVLALSEALKDDDSNVRSSAASALGSIGPAAEAAVPALSEGLRGDTWSRRSSAVAALGSIGPAAAPALIEALRNDDRTVRSSAASALGSIGPATEASVAALSKALNDDDRYVRRSAASALGGIGPAAEAAVPALNKALTDDDVDVRNAARSALDNIRTGTP